MSEIEYDLVVIGSGPAGEKAALQAAYYGAKVCVIDYGPAGGTWVNTGTIPSKTLRESALYIAGGRSKGVVTHNAQTPTMRNFMALKRHLVTRWREKIEANFRSKDVDRIRGKAHLTADHQVAMEDGRVIPAKHIMIATGSVTRPTPDMHIDGVRVHNSDTLLDMENIPSSMAVLGGGVIACEYAAMFQALGIQVTLVNSRERILGFIDPQATEFLERSFVQAGMVIRHQTRAESINNDPQNAEVEVFLNDGTMVAAQTVLVALGRVPFLQGLGIENTDIKLTDWNSIEVDKHMQTSVPNIYAAGDVVGFPSLASAGMEQGRVAAAHMFAPDGDKAVSDLIPSGIFTIPELSSVGMDEEAAIEAAYDPVAAHSDYSESVRAPMLGDEFGMVKLIADRESKKLLGATIVGNQATELIHFAMLMIRYEGKIDDLTHFVFNIPTLSLLYRQTAYKVLSKISENC